MKRNGMESFPHEPFLASSSRCLVRRRYLGDSGHIGRRMSWSAEGTTARPLYEKINTSKL
jgi:hypothetical protein